MPRAALPEVRESASEFGTTTLGGGLPRPVPIRGVMGDSLSAHSDRRHVARAALESIAYQLRDVLDSMRADSGVALQRLHGDGGATANRFLMQFCADVTGVELRVANNPNLSALGAAWMGMLGLGIHGQLADLAGLPQEELIYRPKVDEAVVAEWLRGWHTAVKQVLV